MAAHVCVHTYTCHLFADTPSPSPSPSLPLLSTSNPPPLPSPSSYSFGLEETNYRVEAAELAHKALSLQPCSPWATHTICHVVEESRDAEEGVELLERTREDWENSGLANHISWHVALSYLGRLRTSARCTHVHVYIKSTGSHDVLQMSLYKSMPHVCAQTHTCATTHVQTWGGRTKC